jgi:hypothetical protein
MNSKSHDFADIYGSDNLVFTLVNLSTFHLKFLLIILSRLLSYNIFIQYYSFNK